MSWFKTLGLRTFYRVRRFKKALSNWRKFGVIIFGGLFLATAVAAPAGVSADRILTAVTVNPSSAIVESGATKQFSATAYDQYGETIDAGVNYLWSVTDSQVGDITSGGLFTAGDAGQYSQVIKVAASYGLSTKISYASVTVSGAGGGDDGGSEPADILTAVTLSPSAVILDQGDSKQFSAVAYNQYGKIINSGVTYTWSAPKSSAGSINQAGYFTAGDTPGKYTSAVKVSASYGSSVKNAYATVTVSAVTPPPAEIELMAVTIHPSAVILDEGESKQFSATAYDQYGQQITSGVTYTWLVTEGDAGSINQSGYFTAGNQPGYYANAVQVKAVKGSSTKYDYANVTVSQTGSEIQLMSISIHPVATVLDQGANQQFTATAYDQFGQVISSGVAYTWSTVNGGGSINQSGYFTAGNTEGTFANTVKVVGTRNSISRSAFATVVVNPITTQAVLDRVEIIPSSVHLDTNSNYQFTAQAYDTNNNPMFSGVSYTWSVISGPGSVDQTGRFFSTSSADDSTVRVRATQGAINVYDTAEVNIIDDEVCSGILSYVNITPQTMYLYEGESGDFDAQAYDTDGCHVSATYTWEVMKDEAGTINQSGYFTAGFNDGTYTNAVRVRAYKNGVSRYDYADVVVRDQDDEDDYFLNATLVAKDENGGNLKRGDVVLFTLTLKNNHDNYVTDVDVRMDVPNYTDFISATSYASGGRSPRISNNQVTWSAGDIGYGQSKVLYLRVRVEDSAPAGARIKGSAFTTADEISGFWVHSNELFVEGGTPGPRPPLTPTGAWTWLLAAIMALLATILTGQLMRTRTLLAKNRE